MKRYCYDFIINDLNRKMVFVGSPRQVGKTTLAHSILKNFTDCGRYFNWDATEDRTDILQKKMVQKRLTNYF